MSVSVPIREAEKANGHLAARVFDGPDCPADPVALGRLRAGLASADLAAPPVVLPDFHHKGDKEMPSSIAVATRETIRPTLTSASLNCGMALVALDIEPPGAAAVNDFYRRVRERYPYPPTYRRDLTPAEVVDCAAEGSHFAADRFGVDPEELDRVEEGGRLDIGRFGGRERARHELPWSVIQLSISGIDIGAAEYRGSRSRLALQSVASALVLSPIRA